MHLHPLITFSWTRACGAAVAAAILVACGDDTATTATDATTDATTSATSATATAPTTGGASESASGTTSTTTGETATGETATGETATTRTTDETHGSSDPSSSGSGGESETAAIDTGVACTPGATESCYSGPDGTVDVGVCVAGTRTCDDEGSGFGPCEGEVTPTVEQCETPADENCLGDAPECGAALWKQRFGGVVSDDSNDLAVGPDDGVVITGRYYYGSNISFGGLTLDNEGTVDGFIASFDGDGNHRWSRAVGSPELDAVRSVAIDKTGAVIVTGDTRGTLDLGGAPLVSGGDQDVFVAKFDAEGGHLWSAIYKAPDQQVGKHCAVTSDDGVLLGGGFYGSFDLGGGGLMSAGQSDIYLARYDADGKHLWSRRFGDGDGDYSSATVVDPSDAIIETGYFAGSLNFGGVDLVSAGGLDVFIAKLDGDGDHLWSKRFGDASEERIEAAAVGSDGRILIGGLFDGAIDFGGDVLTSDAGKDAFVAVFDGDGGHLWSRRLHGPMTDRVTTIAADPEGNILVGGVFAGSLDIGGATLTNDGLDGAFLVKYDPAGAVLFSASYSAKVSSWLTTVAADSLGDAFILGHFAGTLDLDGDALMSAGDDDVFLAKIAP